MGAVTQVLKENADLKKDLEKLSRQPKLDKSFTQLQRVQREMESELRLIERHVRRRAVCDFLTMGIISY